MKGYNHIKSERMEKGIMPEEKSERLAEDDFKHFCDMIYAKRNISNCIFTIGIVF